MAQALPFRLEQKDPRVLNVRMEPSGSNWEQWCLVRSDAHHDNSHCVQALELKHLKQAQNRGALIQDHGDFFCAMQGKWDKRADMQQFRPELQRNDYLTALIDYNSEFLQPFAPNFALMSIGNHEDSILNHHHINLTDFLCRNLRSAGSEVKLGRVQGWMRYMFLYRKTIKKSFLLRYHHGWGGGGAVTKGTIQANRQMVFLDDIDILVNGHTHDSYHVTYRREGISHESVPYTRDVECLRCPGYKDEYSPGEGYQVLKHGSGPKPLGAWWLRFFMDEKEVRYEIIRAK